MIILVVVFFFIGLLIGHVVKIPAKTSEKEENKESAQWVEIIIQNLDKCKSTSKLGFSTFNEFTIIQPSVEDITKGIVYHVHWWNSEQSSQRESIMLRISEFDKTNYYSSGEFNTYSLRFNDIIHISEKQFNSIIDKIRKNQASKFKDIIEPKPNPDSYL